ncbi:MAG: glucose 1-dehydrogenase [Sphingomonadales bacterium]|nr:glucose 1-dehydrogenase [Sphingomonadales bacterium]
MIQPDFEGRVAFVTGAASGLGEATARQFARAGAAVLIADVQVELGEAVAADLRQDGARAEFMRCDTGQESEVAASVDRAVGAFGSLDYAVNSAGITGTGQYTADYDVSDWDRLMGVNLRGVFLCMKHQIRRMLAQGSGGAIVNIASVAGLVGRSGSPAYAASKHGVVGLTKVAAFEYAEQKIRVNAICPGMIETAMTKRFITSDPAAGNIEIDKQAIKRLGRADEIASGALWLCSEGAAFTTGQAIAIDGGYVAG